MEQDGAMPGDPYNYERFDEHVRAGFVLEEFTAFPNQLHAGEVAPDFVATDLEGGADVRMSELWRQQAVVMEFGSFT